MRLPILVALCLLAAATAPSGQTPHVIDMAGARHILVLWSDGTVTAMGTNQQGQMGRPVTTDLTFQAPVPVDLPGKAVQVAAGISTSYAVLDDGSVWAWGAGRYGELGVPLGGSGERPTPGPVPGLSDVVSLAAAEHEAMAVLRDGTVRVWGQPPAAIAGGRRVDIGIAPPIAVPALRDIVTVSLGSRYGLALTRDGRVMAWGVNSLGQLGLGTTSEAEPPTEIPALRDVTSIARGTGSGVAVTGDGRVWTWGHNGQAGLGNGQRADTMDPGQPTPQPVAGVATAVEVKAGVGLGRHILVRRADQRLVGWGNTDWGQLGTGGVAFQPTPTLLTLRDVERYWTFGIYSFATTADGALWFWGDQFAGQWLLGTKPNQRVPARVTLDRLRPAPLSPGARLR